MSKGRSGLFPGYKANDKMLRGITYRAIHTMVENTKGGKSKSMAVGAYDVKTGKIVTSFAGSIPEKIHPELLKRAEKIGGIGTKGLSTKNTVGVCAEFHVVNELLLSGSKISDIKLTHESDHELAKGVLIALTVKKFSDLIK